MPLLGVIRTLDPDLETTQQVSDFFAHEIEPPKNVLLFYLFEGFLGGLGFFKPLNLTLAQRN